MLSCAPWLSAVPATRTRASHRPARAQRSMGQVLRPPQSSMVVRLTSTSQTRSWTRPRRSACCPSSGAPATTYKRVIGSTKRCTGVLPSSTAVVAGTTTTSRASSYATRTAGECSTAGANWTFANRTGVKLAHSELSSSLTVPTQLATYRVFSAPSVINAVRARPTSRGTFAGHAAPVLVNSERKDDRGTPPAPLTANVAHWRRSRPAPIALRLFEALAPRGVAGAPQHCVVASDQVERCAQVVGDDDEDLAVLNL